MGALEILSAPESAWRISKIRARLLVSNNTPIRPIRTWEMFPRHDELLRSHLNLALHGRAPWFHAEACVSFRLASYIDENDQLPGGIDACAVRRYEWKKRIASKEHDLAPVQREWGNGRWGPAIICANVWASLVKTARLKLRLLSGPLFNEECRFDL